MSRHTLRTAPLATLLILALALLPAAAHARPFGLLGGAPAANESGATSLLSWLWQSLQSFWGEEGGSLDPNGLRSTSAPEGASLDPNGNHLTGEEGPSLDPDGFSATGDEGASLDPNG